MKRFRALVDDGIRKGIALRLLCRPYDGQVQLRFPTYIETTRGAERFSLTLSCSQFVPGRHASWSDRSWYAVFQKAHSDVQAWIADMNTGGKE